MPEGKVEPTPQPKRKRMRIVIEVTAEQKAQLEREVPVGLVPQYCRDRIFYPWKARDELVDVGARLLGMAARGKRLDNAITSAEHMLSQRLGEVRKGSGIGDEEFLEGLLAQHQYNQLHELLVEARDVLQPLLEETREVRRLIAERQNQISEIPVVEKRADG